MSKNFDSLVDLCIANHTVEELAIGWLCYESVRKLNAAQFAAMCRENLTGKAFDDIVKEALLAWQSESSA